MYRRSPSSPCSKTMPPAPSSRTSPCARTAWMASGGWFSKRSDFLRKPGSMEGAMAQRIITPAGSRPDGAWNCAKMARFLRSRARHWPRSALPSRSRTRSCKVTTSILNKVSPAEVHGVLGRHMLADGFDLVFDFEKSHGSWLHDARAGRDYLDFVTFTASNPIGYNHPGMKDPEFLKVLHRVAQLKPALSDLYSVEYAQFVETFGRLALPPYMKYAFFIEGGTLGVENALKAAFDWKVRRNKAKGVAGERGSQVIHFREAFHGRSGYTLSLTNTDPVKTDYFPKFPWPRVLNPKLRFPVTPEVEKDVAAAEQRSMEQIDRAFTDNPDDIAAIIIEPIQAEGGDNHFRPEFLQALQRKANENEVFFIVDEVQTGVGLTGRMWAHEHFGIRPDALAFGKKTQVCGCLVGP